MKNKALNITLKRSLIGSRSSQKSAVRALGLKHIGQVVHLDKVTAAQLGQINKVRHLIFVKDISK